MTHPCTASLLAFLFLSGAAVAAQEAGDENASFERASHWASQGRFAKASEELRRIAFDALPSFRTTTDAEKKVLRRVVEDSRAFLAKKDQPAGDRRAARATLCRARAYLPEELGGPEPLRVGGGVQRPELIGKPFLRYSPRARKARIQGVELLEALIDQEGCVRHIRVLKMLPMGLDAAAVNSVRSWAFEPARLEGRPVPVYFVITVTFALNRDSEPWDR